MIQVILPTHLVQKHKSKLIIGNAYIMKNFKVAKNEFSFAIITQNFKLIFYVASSAQSANFSDIPLTHLNLISLTDIL